MRSIGQEKEGGMNAKEIYLMMIFILCLLVVWWNTVQRQLRGRDHNKYKSGPRNLSIK